MGTRTILTLKSEYEDINWIKTKKGLEKQRKMIKYDNIVLLANGHGPNELFSDFANVFRLKNPKFDEYVRVLGKFESIESSSKIGFQFGVFNPEWVIYVDQIDKTWDLDAVFWHNVENDDFIDKDSLINDDWRIHVVSIPVFVNRPFGTPKNVKWHEFASKKINCVLKELGIEKHPGDLRELSNKVYFRALFYNLAILELYSRKYVETLDNWVQDGLEGLKIPFKEDFKGDFDKQWIDEDNFEIQY